MSDMSTLAIAARTASTSYRVTLPIEVLRAALLTCDVPEPFMPHVRALLDEAPLDLLAAVVDELHESAGVERGVIQGHMRVLASRYKVDRDL
jgi:hypothetical protein